MQETWIHSLGWEDPLEHGNPLQYSCLEYPHEQRSLVSYSPWGGKESDTTERLSTAQHSTSQLGVLRWPPVKICSVFYFILLDFPDDSVGRDSTCNAGDYGVISLIPGSGRFPGEGNGNLLQYSCLGNPMDRGAWQAPTVHGVAKESDMT